MSTIALNIKKPVLVQSNVQPDNLPSKSIPKVSKLSLEVKKTNEDPKNQERIDEKANEKTNEKVNEKTPDKSVLKLQIDKRKETPQINQTNSSQKQVQISADNYSRYDTQREHIYNLCDMYCGSASQTEREERVLNLQTGRFETLSVTTPEAVEHLFIEIMSNSADNVARSLKENVDPGEIIITMDKKTITVRNGGIPIPIVIHPKWNVYVPEGIFGTLLTSSNYDKNKIKTSVGKNGLGSKACNIFSLVFSVVIGDPNNEKLYKQTWRNNMTNRNEPEISYYSKNSPPFVEVSYQLDFPRFKYKEYPDEAFALFARHAADTSFTLKVPVSFNGHKFNIPTAREYAKLYFEDEKIKSSILYMTWPEGAEIVRKKNVDYAKDKHILPLVEICAVDTPDEAVKISFANGKWTRNNGVHYDAALKSITSAVLKTVNDSIGNKKGKKSDKVPKLNLGDVKKHISLFVSCWVGNPEFDSQTKTELKSPAPKIDVPEEVLKPILRWELVNRLYAELDAKLFRTASKTDGRKKRHLNVDKLHDANKAATNESDQCTLYITEGDSATTFAVKMCGFIPGNKARDYIGTFSLKGKLLNVQNASPDRIFNNKEITELKSALGLKQNVDYRIEENFQTLRYGHLMVLTDADADGKHILGLIFNFFFCQCPTLLARGFVKYMRTKILEAKKGKEKVKFYTQHEFDEWKKLTLDWTSWTLSYYKGLASSTDEDIKEETADPRFVMTHFDEMAPYSLRLAFDQSLSNNRKLWISQWVPDYTVETLKLQPISSFINHELIQFSIVNLLRSIPKFLDGLKESQRKIIYGAMLKWKGAKKDKAKVSQLASFVSEKLNYHYGEKSLENAIVGLAQDYTGSNNLPYFQREGQFGSRYGTSKGPGFDAGSSRYIFVLPEIYLQYIFRKEDEPILEIRSEEGEEIEPVVMLPIIPMHLINGVLGLATAYSTNCVSHNPLDCVYWLQCKLLNLSLPQIKPWYRYFEGEIELKARNPKKEEESDDENLDEPNNESNESNESDRFPEEKDRDDRENNKENEGEENEDDKEFLEDKDEIFIDKNTKVTMVSKGIFEEEGRKIVVTEIPVGRGIQQYEGYLKKLREEKIIKDFKDYSTADKPRFEITGMEKPTLKKLKLIKSVGMSNMFFLDSNNKPVKFDTINDILETFYTIRLAYYQKRKDYILSDIQKKIEHLKVKISFILAVIKGYELIQQNPNISTQESNQQGAILVVKKSKKEVIGQMDFFKYDPDLVKKTAIYALTIEEVEKAQQEIVELEKDMQLKTNKKPEQFWLDDLDDFIKVYCKHYKCTYTPPKPKSPKLIIQ